MGVNYKTLLSKLKPDDYKLVDEGRKRNLLRFISNPQNELNFAFPESYISFIETIGFGYLSNDYFNIFMFDGEEFISFNIGEDSHLELEEYIVFGYDDRNFFFDKDNKLKKGKNAIFKYYKEKSKSIDDACYLAKDFIELITIFAENRKPNEISLRDEKKHRLYSVYFTDYAF